MPGSLSPSNGALVEETEVVLKTAKSLTTRQEREQAKVEMGALSSAVVEALDREDLTNGELLKVRLSWVSSLPKREERVRV